MDNWKDFYAWLETNGYHIYRKSNIFRNDYFITDFDPVEDGDSGEIEETINRIKEKDVFNF